MMIYIYILKYLGKVMTRSSHFKPRSRTDLILWNSTQFIDELKKHFRINAAIDTTLRQVIFDIVKENLDSFCEEGTFRPMFDYGFYLDMGNSLPVCCRQSIYGIHEKKIMNKHIQVLDDNDWICDCVGPCGSLFLLAAKPYQEEYTDIKDFFGNCVTVIVLSIVLLGALNFLSPVVSIV